MDGSITLRNLYSKLHSPYYTISDGLHSSLFLSYHIRIIHILNPYIQIISTCRNSMYFEEIKINFYDSVSILRTHNMELKLCTFLYQMAIFILCTCPETVSSVCIESGDTIKLHSEI